MNRMEQINRDSWELAAIAMTRKGRDVEAYSTSQLRKIMNAANSSDPLYRIQMLIDNYKPAPPQNVQANQAQGIIREKHDKNKKFITRLLQLIQEQANDAQYAQDLLKYILWNIRIIANNTGKATDKLPLILECENVDNKDNILVILKSISSSNQGPRKNNSQNNRQQSDGKYRRKG